jgi:hypothetical protein
MIGGLRRRWRSIDKDPWDANLEFEPMVGDSSELSSETETSAQALDSSLAGSNGTTTAEYYMCLVRAAIENGGRHGEHQISIPWLRMILAGLEFRRIEPDMMWYGFESGIQEVPSADIPAYDRLFPPAKDSLAGFG